MTRSEIRLYTQWLTCLKVIRKTRQFCKRTSKHKWFRGILISGLGVYLSSSIPAEAQDVDVEYRVKAICLYNFALFVDWPQEVFQSDGEHFTFCLVGEDPFGPLLKDLEKKTVKSKPVSVRHFPDPTPTPELATCHLLYMNGIDQQEEEKIDLFLKDSPVLTVSDYEDGSALFHFFIEEEKVKFEIKLEAARQRNLRVSAQLLKLARVR